MNKTKKIIFDSAISVFSAYGYEGATMDQIASKAGVAKGTLYYHFKSKEEIFRYIITEGMRIIREQIETETQKKTKYIDKIKTMCRIQLSLVYKNRDFFKLIMSELWGQEMRQLELRKVISEYISSIEEYVKNAMKEGTVKKENSFFMAYTIFGSLCSTAIFELINKDKSNVDEVIDNLLGYILRGIAVV